MELGHWKGIVIGALQGVIQQEEYLNHLDRELGDGDHGTTITRGMSQAIKVMETKTFENANDVFVTLGTSMLESMGGASGVLFGELFRSARKCNVYTRVDSRMLFDFFSKGLETLHKRSQAALGDKTFLDVVVPVVETLKDNLANENLVDVLERVADTAERSSESTKDMVAKFGRAKFVGERSKGIMDPGAVSITYFFKGLYEGTKNCKEAN